MWSILLSCAVASLLPAGAGGRAVELGAKTWINPPALQVPDDRQYVLLFFTPFADRDLKRWVAALNQLDRRKDTIVIALTPARAERVKPFVEKQGFKFAVGAGSRSYAQFKVKDFPHVVVLGSDRTKGTEERAFIDPRDLERWLPALPPEDLLESGAFDEGSPVANLQRHAHEDPDDDQRLRALRALRGKLDPEAFMRLCDEILSYEWGRMRGLAAYEKHLADPNTPVKQSVWLPSVVAGRALRENPSDPKWQPVHDYFAGIGELTSADLARDYHAHMGEDPVDLLIRRGIPAALEKRPDKDNARAYLMEMLPLEPDAVVRLFIAGAFLDVCEPGDFDCADFLEGHLAREENIRSVRPMLEYTIRYLRTGEE